MDQMESTRASGGTTGEGMRFKVEGRELKKLPFSPPS